MKPEIEKPSLSVHPLRRLLDERIAIIDGAMGTTLRTYGMSESDIRGERFADAKKHLLNNSDLFSVTQPQMVSDIHRRFLDAGADIIETNTFGATTLAQSEFFVDDPRDRGGRKNPEFFQRIIEDRFLNELAWEINEPSARQCRACADRSAAADGRPRFVAGAIGPLTVSLSASTDADDPGFRSVTFEQVKAAYAHQTRALIAGGCDLLLVETIFDSLNAKAALVAIREVFDADGKGAADHRLGGGRARRRDHDLRPDRRGILECGQPGQAARGGAQLLARPRPDVSVPVGAGEEVDRRDLLLPQRWPAEPAVADRIRSQPGRHGALPGRVRRSGLAQHRGRLLRQHAGAHRRDQPRGRGQAPARARGARARSHAGVRLCPDGERRVGRARVPSVAALRLAAVHAASRRLRDDRRAHQRRPARPSSRS